MERGSFDSRVLYFGPPHGHTAGLSTFRPRSRGTRGSVIRLRSLQTGRGAITHAERSGIAMYAMPRPPRKRSMLNTRPFSTSTLSQRSSARRRVRRSGAADRALYCRTNGCTTYMRLDTSGRATCPICGASRLR